MSPSILKTVLASGCLSNVIVEISCLCRVAEQGV